MRALEPVQTGQLVLCGFEVGYEVFGDPQAPAVLFLPNWPIAHARHWKMQIPYLARFCRVIVYDAAGNGGGERTTDPAAYELDRVIDQGIGLLDHLGVPQASVVGVSLGGSYGLWMAARYPERVARLFLIGTVLPEWAFAELPAFWEKRETYEGWEKRNAHYWREFYPEWLEFFFSQALVEPHSSKPLEDLIGYGRETTPEILISSCANAALMPNMPLVEVLQQVHCPVLLIHGTQDHIADIEVSRRLAQARPDWSMVTFEGNGHAIHARDPVKTNLLLADFLDLPQPQQRHWQRASLRRKPRALFISSPIGLGHIQRDLAIARELRRLVPELQIEWLAQDPVSRTLEQNGETIHPMSSCLASESAHWEDYAGEHRLNCFQAWRNMDQTLLANFMVFLDVVRDRPYDVWIGDEAWDVDYYLHENPELKTAPFVFLTDFLGWLPVNGAAESPEAFLTADYNAEMIEQVERYRRVRDRAIYIGDYEDLVPERFGPGLPFIPDWAQEHFSAVGYITPFDPADYTDIPAVRARLGYDRDRRLIICAIGGTSVGRHLLGKAIQAWPLIQQERPDAQSIVVAGPRIDRHSLPGHPGVVHTYVHNLYEHLAVADLAIVQGGLSTTMELTVTRRPFIYFPLKEHCEQIHHVAYRLDRYRAGQRLAYAETGVEDLAEAVLATLGADTGHYRPHAPGAAERAATLVAELL